MARKRRREPKEYIRAFWLPNGRWSIQYGRELSEKGARYKELRYPCFWIVDGVLQSVTPVTKTVGEKTPFLIPSLVRALRHKGTPLRRDHALWLRHVAALARRRNFIWLYMPFSSKQRRLRKRRGKDFWADMAHGCNTFATTALSTQTEYLSALHEIGHLHIKDWNLPNQFLRVEAEAWYWALSHTREEITDRTYATMIACYRSYLRYYRRLNLNRQTVWPVPMVARSFVAEYRGYENRPYAHKITDLARSTTHKKKPRARRSSR